MDERVTHAGLGGDVPHGDGREATLGEELLGRVEDGRGRLLPAPRAAALVLAMTSFSSSDDAH